MSATIRPPQGLTGEAKLQYRQAHAKPVVDPYTYLVDVLQRVSEHPASRVIELTPREWKTRFSNNPMKSDLALAQQ